MKNVDVEKQLNIFFYKDTIAKRIKYLNNKKIINKNSKDEINFSINEENMAKQELMWYTYNLIALNEQYSNNDYVAFFVTITLQSQFHKYKSFKNNHINNPKYIGLEITSCIAPINLLDNVSLNPSIFNNSSFLICKILEIVVYPFSYNFEIIPQLK